MASVTKQATPRFLRRLWNAGDKASHHRVSPECSQVRKILEAMGPEYEPLSLQCRNHRIIIRKDHKGHKDRRSDRSTEEERRLEATRSGQVAVDSGISSTPKILLVRNRDAL